MAADHSQDRSRWARDVLCAVDELDGLIAMALRLIYDCHSTQAQVAARLRLPEPEVRARVAAGLQQLAALLLPTSRSLPGPAGAGPNYLT